MLTNSVIRGWKVAGMDGARRKCLPFHRFLVLPECLSSYRQTSPSSKQLASISETAPLTGTAAGPGCILSSRQLCVGLFRLVLTKLIDIGQVMAV